MAKTEDLKHLQTRLAKAKADYDFQNGEHIRSGEKLRDARTELDRAQRALDQFNTRNAGLTITEHAILRYLERVGGLDIEAIRAEMLPPELDKAITAAGNGKFPGGKCRLVVKNRVVVTVET